MRENKKCPYCAEQKRGICENAVFSLLNLRSRRLEVLKWVFAGRHQRVRRTDHGKP